MLRHLTKGIIKENPILILTIGLCPALACSTTTYNGFGMGLAVIFVLTCSNFLISIFKNAIPQDMRIPIFITVIATFVTIVDYIIKAYFPILSESLGVFIPLIVVNCIILARAEVFASKNKIIHSLLDGLGMGIGFTLVLTIVGTIRELIGNGTILGKSIITNPCIIFILPPGAFLSFGLLVSFVKFIEIKTKKIEVKASCHTCSLAKICFKEQ